MGYYDTIHVVKGDDKPEINLTLKDANTAAGSLVLDPNDPDTWAAIDISNPTIRVKFRKLGSTTVLDTMTCLKISPYTNGECQMAWNLTTLDVEPGIYEGEIELEYSDGRKFTLFDKLKFKVRDEF